MPPAQYTNSLYTSSRSSTSSSSYMYPEARGEKRSHTKVPKAEWEYKLNPRHKSSSSVTPKRARPGKTGSTSQGSVENLEPLQSVPKFISTKRFVARVPYRTWLERGKVTRVWVDLEYNGEKYNPGKDDLLVAELTSGWMRRSLFGQGLKRETYHEGERHWCMFVYQPREGNVKYIPAEHILAKVTSQHLEVDWPPLPTRQPKN